jgi:hypothetical protein
VHGGLDSNAIKGLEVPNEKHLLWSNEFFQCDNTVCHTYVFRLTTQNPWEMQKFRHSE